MADVKVKVIEEFRDRTADLKLRKKDEVLAVSEERAKKLAGLGLVEVYEETTNSDEVTEAVEETTDVEQKKKRSKKK